jgi:hypothetical protein
MKQPLRDSNRTRKNTQVSIPPPVGGLNKRDSIDAMAPTDAIEMDNWLPQETDLVLRKGFKEVCQSSPTTNLMPFESGENKHFIFGTNGALLKFDITQNEPEELRGNFYGDNWRGQQYKERLFMVSGQDNPVVYNGTEILNNPFTVAEGEILDMQDLSDIALYKNRLFFIQRGTLKFWYTENAGNVSGNIKSYDLSQLASLGGELVSINNWTQSGAQGADNQRVLITNNGEVFVYSGSNPGDASLWELKGLYQIPRVIKGRNTEKFGGDLIVITCEGYFALSQLLSPSNAQTRAFSNKIDGAVKQMKNKFDFNGWQIKYLLSESLLLINVPISSGQTVQHVMNTSSGAWSRFTGINAAAWETLDGKTYFAGTNGNIYQMFETNSDNGVEIQGYVQQAYNAFGVMAMKAFKQADFIISGSLKPRLRVSFGVDFKEPRVSYSSSGKQDEKGWNKSVWNKDAWQLNDTFRVPVILFAQQGYKGSLGVKTQAMADDIRWHSTLITFEAAK